MKKKIFYLLIILIIVLVVGYQFIYQDHRNIAAEKASFAETTEQIHSAFSTNEIEANAKYLDKTIEVKGKITSTDLSTKSMVIDDKLNALFENDFPNELQKNDSIIIKGRLVGYDSLLDELQMDQCIKK